MGHKKSQLKLGALINYFAIGFNVIAGIIYTPWMIEQIGRNDYGLYTLANSVIAMFLMDFGLSSATGRYVAKYRARGETEELNKFLNIIYRLYILIDAIIFIALIIVFFCSELIYHNLTAEELVKFKVVYCIAGLYSLISFPCVTFNGILNAFEEFLPLKISDLLQKILAILFTVIALYNGLGLYALVTVNATCGLVAILIKFFYVRKNTKIKSVKLESKEQRRFFKEIFTFSWWATVCTLSYRLIFNISPTLIGLVMTNAAEAISVFGIITTIEGYFHIITTAIDGMFISRITRLLNKENWKDELNKFAVLIGRFQFGLNGLLVVAFLLVGKEFIRLWVGDEFIEAYLSIVFIVVPSLFYNALHILHTVISVRNLIKYQAYIQISAGICNVIGTLILCYFFGVVGASFSIGIAFIVRIALMLWFSSKKVGLDVKYFFKMCYLKMCIPIVVSLGLGFVLVTSLDFVPLISESAAISEFLSKLPFGSVETVTRWFAWVLEAAIVSLIYILSVWFFGLKSSERKSILGKFGRKRKN